jgi:hypothetical protein
LVREVACGDFLIQIFEYDIHVMCQKHKKA